MSEVGIEADKQLREIHRRNHQVNKSATCPYCQREERREPTIFEERYCGPGESRIVTR